MADQAHIVALHHVHPVLRVVRGRVLEPDRFPIALQRAAVLLLEGEPACHRGMLERLAPGRVLVAVALRADLYHVQHHRHARGEHVARDVPGMQLGGRRRLLDLVDGGPSVKRAGVVLERHALPDEFVLEFASIPHHDPRAGLETQNCLARDRLQDRLQHRDVVLRDGEWITGRIEPGRLRGLQEHLDGEPRGVGVALAQ